MRKLILLGLAALILMGSAILTISWISRSHAVKKDVEAYIASFTTANLDITYKDIKVSGFPFSMNVSIENPHITGHINKFVQEIALDKIFKLENLPEWSEDYTLNGSINFQVNALSNKFRIELLGDIAGKAVVGGMPISINSQSSAGSVCELTLNNRNWLFGNLWNVYLLRDNNFKLVENLRSVDCVLPAGKLVSGDIKEPMFTYGNSRLYISRNPGQNSSDIHFYLLVKDMEATKAYDTIYNTYSISLYPKASVISPSTYGKQNLEIDLSYSGSENWKTPQAKNVPLSFKINKFIISNGAYNADTKLSLAYNIKDNMKNADFSYTTKITATELFRSILHTNLHNIVDTIRSGSSNYARETKAKLMNMSDGDTNKLIYSILPDFTSLGEMTTKIEANYTGSEDMKNYTANLKSFELSAKPYGVTSNGSVKMDSSNPLPTGNMSISCANCANMLDTFANYVEKVQYALSIFYPANSPIPQLTSDSVKSFKEFLIALAPTGTGENSGTLKFDIVNDGKGVKVNGKDNAEVTGLFNSKFNIQLGVPPVSAVPQAAPATPAQPAPAAPASVPAPKKK